MTNSKIKWMILCLAIFAFPRQSRSQTVVPPTFFGMDWNNAPDFPSVPFGAIRLWDTGTTWAQIETGPGVYSWGQLDAWLATASRNDKDVIYTFGFVPTFASSNPTQACSDETTNPGCAAPPADLTSGDNAWKTFVTALVNHSLSDPSKHISYYEIWNEPDLLQRWTGTPAQLAIMATDAYTIIKTLDPTAKVIGPSPSTANQWGAHFLPAYYAAGGAIQQDIVGLHAYLYVADGSTFSTSPEGITTSISQLRSLMSIYGISSKPIFFTEGSYGSCIMTDAQKVAYIGQEYLLMATGGVARYYWYSWDSAGFGTMWNASSGIQPVGTAYGQLNRWMVGATVSPCVSSGTVYTCSLSRAVSYKAVVAWDTSGPSVYPVPLQFSSYRDLAGVTHPIAGTSVTIGPEPIILEFPAPANLKAAAL